MKNVEVSKFVFVQHQNKTDFGGKGGGIWKKKKIRRERPKHPETARNPRYSPEM